MQRHTISSWSGHTEVGKEVEMKPCRQEEAQLGIDANFLEAVIEGNGGPANVISIKSDKHK